MIHGQETVCVCEDCRTPSTADLAGIRSFRIVARGWGAVLLCRDCAESASKTLVTRIFPSSASPARRS